MLYISTAELTTLSLRVVAKYTIGQVDTEYEPREGDLGLNFRDDEHCINTSGNYTEIPILVCRTNRLVIHRNLKQKHYVLNVRNNLLCKVQFYKLGLVRLCSKFWLVTRA